MEFTNDELCLLIDALNDYWAPNSEETIDILVDQFHEKLKEQRM